MDYTKDKLEKKAHSWEAQSINDQLAGREPTLTITVEMPMTMWERIWSEDASIEMYEALKGLLRDYSTNPNSDIFYEACRKAREALAKADSRDKSELGREI